MKAPRDARSAAVQALGEVLEQNRTLGEATALDALGDDRERAFARRLAYGVLRWKGALDWLAAELLDRPLRAKEQAVHRLLLLGLYQLWREDTADHAAIHATAETARALGKPWAVGLVNAVLRRFQRERQTLLDRLDGQPDRHAHPAWLLDALQTDWPDDWSDIVAANNREAPLWLRVNLRRGTTRESAAALRAAGFDTEGHPLAPAALAVFPPAPVQVLPGFAEGRFSVQDPAAQLAADLLDLAPGQRVLDACAAPGGKTCHLLEHQPDLDLLALDVSETRLDRVRENLDRLGLAAELHAADASNPEAWWDGRAFQRILLDAPCTATGVIRRHPEIKWLRDEGQLTGAVALQARLLRGLWPLLEAGGILVYATCSVLRRENSEQIDAFLAEHADASPGAIGDFGRPGPTGRQLLPGEQDTDGFYYAVLRKSAA